MHPAIISNMTIPIPLMDDDPEEAKIRAKQQRAFTHTHTSKNTHNLSINQSMLHSADTKRMQRSLEAHKVTDICRHRWCWSR